MRLLSLAFVLVMIGTVATAEEIPRPLSRSEIIRRMSNSSVEYRVNSASKSKVSEADFESLAWPSLHREIERPMVIWDGGHASIHPLHLSPAIARQMAEGERLYESQRFQEAAAIFTEVIATDPKCYTAHLYLGDCAFAQRDMSAALGHYQTAYALNPSDYQTAFFLGDALFNLQRYPEAVVAYTNALVARPGYRPLVEALLEKARALGATVHDDPFTPRATARKAGKAVEVIYADGATGDASWLVYGMCKGFWIGDRAHRKEMRVSEGTAWSTIQEFECLANLSLAYDAGRAESKLKRDPALDRLSDAAKAGLLDAFVAYEIGGRINPDITLTMTEAGRARIRDYVARFILVPWAQERAEASP